MQQTVEILSVNISGIKDAVKTPVVSVDLTEEGITGDVHYGTGHLQVSMLSGEKIEDFAKETGRRISYGEFGENITVKNLSHLKTGVFSSFYNDNVELEITQSGKKCKGTNCRIFQETGKCLMPEEGIFLWVKKGGKLKPGDQLLYKEKTFNIHVITVSDRASQGIYEDKSGPALASMIGDFFNQQGRLSSIHHEIIPDEPVLIRSTVSKAVNDEADILFTTGGTGIGPRDNTPEVILPMLTKQIPGIMELIRVKYGMNIPNALLSRGVAGVINQTLVYTLPGSEKAVREYAEEILKTVNHSMLMVRGIGAH